MSSLPREVHEVLEQEYVSMYGPLDRIPTDYTADQIVDVAWVHRILRACELGKETLTKEGLAQKLNGFLETLPETLDDSPAMTSTGRALVERYKTLSAAAKEEKRLDELNRRIVDDAFSGAVRPLCDLRLAGVYSALHQRAEDPARARTALCISGGGIRSATFALGIIQGLASSKVLDKFDYLSTVSGGGYIGSWLSSWVRRHPHGISGVQEDLAHADTGSGGTRPASDSTASLTIPSAREDKIEPEPQPMRHLREYSNYLSPRLGLLSGDTWTMGALYVRNLLLNLLVIVPILAALLALPRAYAWLSRRELFDSVWWAWPMGSVFFMVVAFAYIGWHRPVDDQLPKHQKMTDGSHIAFCVIPLVLAAIFLTQFWVDAVAQPKLLEDHPLWIPYGICFLAMTLWPWALNRVRHRAATAHAPGTAPLDEEALKSHAWKKALLEFGGSLVGFVTASALLLLLAWKVFDQPLLGFAEMIRDASTRPPALREVSTTPWSSLYIVLAVPAVLLVFFIQASIFVGISSKRNEDYDREWWGRAGAWLFVAAAAWAALAGMAIFGPVALYNAPILLGSIGGLSGLLAGGIGFSATTPASGKQKEQSGVIAAAGNAGLSLTVPLFVCFFLALISLGTTWLAQEVKPLLNMAPEIDYKQYKFAAQVESRAQRVTPDVAEDRAIEVTDQSKPAPLVSLEQLRSLNHLDSVYWTTGVELGALLALAVLAWFFSKRIGVNKFSMQALYRNRLIRAYLGASRYSRQPNPFTGFDERDNLAMYQLRPELLWSSDLKEPEVFFQAMKEGARTTQTDLQGDRLERRKLAQHIWSRLYKKTKDAIGDEDRTPTQLNAAIEAVVQNLNAILVDERTLLESAVNLPKDFWATPRKCKTPYSGTLRNRAVLDHFLGDVLNPMSRPKDEVSGETAVAVQQEDNFRKTGAGFTRRPPMHIVNMALNLVGGDKLAWQQRMAETFTSSAYHTGNLFLGYRDSRQYGGRKGISLGTTVAISGAAASPNMGYHSSPALAFLLTLFNVRLGSWLGNPGPAGQDTYEAAHPTSNLKPIISEAIGQTNDSYEWIYLSDGGHFENLGLYEMVLRRCHYIILSDGGADPKYAFEDLGNAIRKIRTDLGVPIDIGETFMHPRSADSLAKEGRYYAVGTIRYTAVDGPDARDGLLIYIKPGCYKDANFPRDVYNYALESTDFPHESTADQFFSESQFESYRALGRHAINEICGDYMTKPTGVRIPITNTFDHVAELAQFVAKPRDAAGSLPPAELIASAILQLNR
jgi:hypothetical protein